LESWSAPYVPQSHHRPIARARSCSISCRCLIKAALICSVNTGLGRQSLNIDQHIHWPVMPLRHCLPRGIHSMLKPNQQITFLEVGHTSQFQHFTSPKYYCASIERHMRRIGSAPLVRGPYEGYFRKRCNFAEAVSVGAKEVHDRLRI
jgi:hypothetical protein